MIFLFKSATEKKQLNEESWFCNSNNEEEQYDKEEEEEEEEEDEEARSFACSLENCCDEFSDPDDESSPPLRLSVVLILGRYS